MRYFFLHKLRHLNIRFTKEKETDHKIPFLDVLIHNDTHFPVTSVYRKKTCTGLLTNYFSFIYLIPTNWVSFAVLLIANKINNTWLGFHENIKKLTEILKKNLFPAHLVERVVKRYLTLTRTGCNPPVSVSDTITNFYFKLPYIGPFSVVTQEKGSPICKALL